MMTELEYPFVAAQVRDLKAGAMVSLSGRIFTGRDRMHKYMVESGRCPVDLKDGAIFHCGPVVLLKDGIWVVTAAGPTTSMRQEPYMERVLEKFRPRLIIGKGGMGGETLKACRRYECVYLQAVGGAGALLAQSVVRVEGVHMLKEFGMADAMWELIVKNFHAVVTMDVHGRSLHKIVQSASRRNLIKVLR